MKIGVTRCESLLVELLDSFSQKTEAGPKLAPFFSGTKEKRGDMKG